MHEFGEQYYMPGVSVEDDIFKTETFGPVVASMTFTSDEEALDIIKSSSKTGLASSSSTRLADFAHRLCGCRGGGTARSGPRWLAAGNPSPPCASGYIPEDVDLAKLLPGSSASAIKYNSQKAHL